MVRRSGRDRRWRPLVALAFLAVVIAGIGMLCRRAPAPPRLEAAAVDGPRSSLPPQRPPGGRDRDVIRAERGEIVAERLPTPSTARPRDPKHLRAALEDYRKANRFPPTSQPLLAHHTDLMRPNQRYERELPSQHDPEVGFLYTGAKNTIVGNEPIGTSLLVSRGDDPIDVRIVEAEARVEALGISVPLTYRRVGDRYVNELASDLLGIDRVANVETEIWFEAAPGMVESRSLTFFYTPEAAIPARFTGEFRDALEDGSLVIYAGIDVRLEGHYVLDLNLYGPGGEPVMFSRHKNPIPAGRSEVRFLFFGKALREVGISPPFHIGQLRGARFVLGQDPDTEPMPLFDWEYTTRTPFVLDDLSDAEWSDPHKDQMIQYLEGQLAAAGEQAP